MTDTTNKKTEEQHLAEIKANFETIVASWPLRQLVALEQYAFDVALSGLLAERAGIKMDSAIVKDGGLDPKDTVGLFTNLGHGVTGLLDAFKDEAVNPPTVEAGPNNIFDKLAAVLKEGKPLREEANRVQKQAYPSPNREVQPETGESAPGVFEE